MKARSVYDGCKKSNNKKKARFSTKNITETTDKNQTQTEMVDPQNDIQRYRYEKYFNDYCGNCTMESIFQLDVGCKVVG